MNKGFGSDFILELKRKSDIVSIVSNYVRLDEKGRRFWGCCPFHSEKTASFSVLEDEGVFYCYGCRASGDVITFVQRMENLDFMDAVKFLADRAGMKLPEFGGSKDYAKEKDERERLLQVLDFAYKHYMENLYSPEAKAAQEYVKSRKFTRRELEDFKIGYSKGWQELPIYLGSKGFTQKEMIDAGVCCKKNNNFFDPLADRLVFPIFNSFSQCIGFSARALVKTDFAKYKNTAETKVFQKGKVVFGINILRAQKQQQLLDKIILVEGQMDVIAMHKAGFKSTVACMGTALTADHVRELVRYNKNIYLCFDGDAAGQKATLRAIEMFRFQDVNLRVVRLEGGKDPDEVLNNLGKEKLQQMIDNAIGYMEFLIEYNRTKFNLADPEQKGKFVKVVLAEIKKLESPSLFEPYLEIVRDLTKIPLDVLRRDINLQPQQAQQPLQTQKKQVDDAELQEQKKVERGDEKATKFILASLLHKQDYVDPLIDYRKLIDGFDEILDIIDKNLPLSAVYSIDDAEENPFYVDLVNFNAADFGGNAQKYFNECLWKLAEAKLKKMQAELNEEYRACEDLDQRSKIAKRLGALALQQKNKSLEEFNVRR